jgi:hypothetical protein
MAGVGKPSPLAGATPIGANDYPGPGEWPCQRVVTPEEAAQLPPALVAFCYRLLRDGAQAPADVETHAIQAAKSRVERTTYTNPHLESYAYALAAHLTAGRPLAEQPTEVLPSQGGAKVLPPPPMPPGGTP